MKKFLSIVLGVILCMSCFSCTGDTPFVDTEFVDIDVSSDELNSDATLSLISAFYPETSTHGNPWVAGFPLGPATLMFEKLFDANAYASANNKFEGFIGESFEIDNKQKTITVKIREGCLWSDGKEITSSDVYAGIMMEFNRKLFFDYCTSLEVIDKYTLKGQFLKISPVVMDEFLGGNVSIQSEMYSEHLKRIENIFLNYRVYDEEKKIYRVTDKGNQLYSTFNLLLGRFKPNVLEIPVPGPFKPSSNTTDQFNLIRNDKYFKRELIKFQNINCLKYTTLENISLLVKKGEVDFDTYELPPKALAEIYKKFPNTRNMYSPVSGQIGLNYNANKYPFNILEFRKAVSHIIDRDAIVSFKGKSFVRGDEYGVGMSPIIIDKELYAKKEFITSLERYEYNLEKAEALLKSIGWKRNNQNKWVNEKNEQVTFTLTSPGLMLEGDIYREMLLQFGFNVTYQPKDANLNMQFIEEGGHQADVNYVAVTWLTFPNSWSNYNAIYNGDWHQIKQANGLKREDDLVMDNGKGEKVNITAMVDSLSRADSQEEVIRLTEELARITNENCLLASVCGMTEHLKVYDTKMRFKISDYDNTQRHYNITNFDEVRGNWIYLLKKGNMYKVK